jgi:hypothetical protein
MILVHPGYGRYVALMSGHYANQSATVQIKNGHLAFERSAHGNGLVLVDAHGYDIIVVGYGLQLLT